MNDDSRPISLPPFPVEYRASPIRHFYLRDPEAAKRAAQAVANQLKKVKGRLSGWVARPLPIDLISLFRRP